MTREFPIAMAALSDSGRSNMNAARISPELFIERLEPRIAPATLLSTTAVRYIDVDGDIVIVSISKGSLDLLTNFTFAAAGRGEQLQRISLTGEAFAGTQTVA